MTLPGTGAFLIELEDVVPSYRFDEFSADVHHVHVHVQPELGVAIMLHGIFLSSELIFEI